MTTEPPFAGLRTFLKAPAYDEGSLAEIAIVGAPYDLGTSFRSGARFGPSAIREASMMLTDGIHPHYGVDPVRDIGLVDAGDCEIGIADPLGMESSVKAALDRFPHVVLLGGDHSVTLPALRSAHRRHGKFAIVHFDAHVDTWPSPPSNHGTFMRDAIVEGLVDPTNVVQIGIRSPVPGDVMDWTRLSGVRIITAEDVMANGTTRIGIDMRSVVKSLPIYLTFDIDAIDPSQAPGTGTPEIGGLWTWQVKRLLTELRDCRFIGMDVVEVSPAYDVSQITALAAATIVWEYLSAYASRKRSVAPDQYRALPGRETLVACSDS